MSVLFLVVYSLTNALAARRGHVPSFAFAWERHIPFLPIFIVPYMSIDLFFVAAPFLCTNRDELKIFCRRIAAAILIAGAFFLLMPLRFSFDRPAVNGVLGVVFNWFRGMDQPFNQFPSLHIALRTILADTYTRHTRGALRWIVAIWFSLIGCSTLLTYQHHVIDLLGGFVLAAIIFYAIRPGPLKLTTTGNRRVGAYYALSGALCIALAIVGRPWTLVLLWPALALAIVSLGYFGLGAAIWRKEAGTIPLSTRLLLAPILLGQRWSWRHYARRSDAWNAITPTVWLGRHLSRAEAQSAIDQGVTAVLDVTGEFTGSAPFRKIRYLNLPVLDLTAPGDEDLQAAADFIASESQRGIVYVHCKAGYSRSAAAVAAYLLHAGLADSADAAFDRIRHARSGIVIRPEIKRALDDHARQ